MGIRLSIIVHKSEYSTRERERELLIHFVRLKKISLRMNDAHNKAGFWSKKNFQSLFYSLIPMKIAANFFDLLCDFFYLFPLFFLLPSSYFSYSSMMLLSVSSAHCFSLYNFILFCGTVSVLRNMKKSTTFYLFTGGEEVQKEESEK